MDGDPVRYERGGVGILDHYDAYLFELARQNIDNFLFLSLVGVDEILLTFTRGSAGVRVSPDRGRHGHGSEGSKATQEVGAKVHFRNRRSWKTQTDRDGWTHNNPPCQPRGKATGAGCNRY